MIIFNVNVFEHWILYVMFYLVYFYLVPIVNSFLNTFLLILLLFRQQVLEVQTLIPLPGKTKSVKESRGFLLR